jgi:probable phosphoglycerate mutase
VLGALLLAAAALADIGPIPAGAVRVFLVRHGQAYTNLTPPPDLPPEKLDALTDHGRSQARRCGEALRGAGIALVLHSPAARARQTAEEIAAAVGRAETRLEPRLRPLDLGRSASGGALTWDDRIAEWKAGRDPQPDGGESLAQVGERVLGLVRALAGSHEGRGVVLVAHSDVVGAFTGLLGGKPPAQRYPFGIGLGSITVVDARRSGTPMLVLANELPR